MNVLQHEREERKMTTLLYIGSMLLLLVLLFITFRNMNEYANAVSFVRQRNLSLIELEGQLSSLRDAELGVRGYLLSGDSSYLEPYTQAQLRFQDHTTRLRVVEMDTADQRAMAMIWDGSLKLRRVWREMIQQKALDIPGHSPMADMATSRNSMDQIRTSNEHLVKKWRNERDALLVLERTQGVDAPFMLAVYSLLAILATGVLFWRLTRTLRKAEEVRYALKVKLKDLDREVSQRAELQIMLQKVLNNSPSGIMSFRSIRNGSGTIVDFEYLSSNDTADAMVGRSDLVGKRLLLEMPEHENGGLFNAYVAVVERDEPMIKEFHFDGPTVKAWFRAHAVKLDDGFLVSFMDITEQVEAHALLQEADRLELTAQIVRTVAHEVRNPLTNIHLSIEQLQDETEGLEERTQPYFAIIDRNLERIGKLITAMLQGSQKRELNLVPCSMDDIVNSTLKAVEDRLTLHGMRSEVSIDPDLPEVMADCELIHLAVTNIAVNAVEAMVATTGVLRFHVHRTADAVNMEITDNGKGIPPETLKRLFEPFFTGRSGGLGLGLTTSRSILHSHQVKLDVQSKEGVGTTFTLRFPKAVFAVAA